MISVELQPSSSQMHWVLFLCVVVASPSPPDLVKPLSLDIEHWLASFSAPSAPILQEKVPLVIFKDLDAFIRSFSHADFTVFSGMVCGQ